MKSSRKNLGIALLFLAPNLLGFFLFTLVPVVMSLAGSFTTWSLRPTVPLQFVCLANYQALFTDKNFYFYLYNTIYLMLGIPIGIAGSLFLAITLNGKFEFRKPKNGGRAATYSWFLSLGSALLIWLAGFQNIAVVIFAFGLVALLGFKFGSVSYRTFLYLPFFTAGAGTILLWSQLFNPNFGLINEVLRNGFTFLGLDWQAPGWLTSTKSLLGFLPLPATFNNGGFGWGAREAIMMMGIWGGIGGNNMLLYLAGLSGIAPELYEAADIDGASRWQRFRYVTWPQLAPTTFFITVISTIGGLQGGFEQARLMTEGGPAGATTTLSYYIYTQGFERLDLGYGCAVAWVLFLLIFVITLFNWKYGKTEVN
ncbi:sugar ABC transporter permease [bacterium]|nr:MAG: sugar ABC transporter permease [bacterium]